MISKSRSLWGVWKKTSVALHCVNKYYYIAEGKIRRRSIDEASKEAS